MVSTRKEQLSVSGSFPESIMKVNEAGNEFEFVFHTFFEEITFRANGTYTDGYADTAYPIRTRAIIEEVVLSRRTPGSSGTTTVDVLVDRNSIFDTQTKPSLTSAQGINAIDIKNEFDSGENTMDGGEVLEVHVDSAESGTPADLIVIVRITRLVSVGS